MESIEIKGEIKGGIKGEFGVVSIKASYGKNYLMEQRERERRREKEALIAPTYGKNVILGRFRLKIVSAGTKRRST